MQLLSSKRSILMTKRDMDTAWHHFTEACFLHGDHCVYVGPPSILTT